MFRGLQLERQLSFNQQVDLVKSHILPRIHDRRRYLQLYAQSYFPQINGKGFLVDGFEKAKTEDVVCAVKCLEDMASELSLNKLHMAFRLIRLFRIHPS